MQGRALWRHFLGPGSVCVGGGESQYSIDQISNWVLSEPWFLLIVPHRGRGH